MSNQYLIIAILVAAVVTFSTRIFPFIFFEKRKPSNIILLFEKYMPLMIITILIFYTIKETKIGIYPYGIPELLGIMTAFTLHVKFKSALLSIISAAILYMFLIQVAVPRLQAYIFS